MMDIKDKGKNNLDGFPLLKGPMAFLLLGSRDAFTLVELIVVVTILALLSTIGFVSYSSYLSGVRDTNRLSQLVAISDGLELYRTKKTLPIPDDNIEIRANGTVIGYQGYAGINVLETIDYSKTGKDPKDKTYFSYYLTQDKKHYQLLTYLEEEENLEVKNSLFQKTHADTDYTNRYPKVSGKKLGILTQSGTNIPVQEITALVSSGYLDLIEDPTSYISNFTDINKTSGVRSSMYKLNKLPPINLDFDESLILYWDMETVNSDGKMLDLTGNGNSGVCYNSTSIVTCGTIGSGPQLEDVNPNTGKSMSFNGTNNYISKPDNNNFLGSGNHTILTLIKTTSSAQGIIINKWSTYYQLGINSGKINARIVPESHPTNPTVDILNQNAVNDGNWHLLTQVWDDGKLRLYIDGELIEEKSSVDPNVKANTLAVHVGGYVWGACPTYCRFFNGSIDEVRFYNRALSDVEINKLYDRIK